MHILLVEDDATLGRALEEFLLAQGYAVDWCTHGAQAVRQLAQAGCDLILLDLNLPDMSGADILRSLRAQGRTTPVLVLTAHDSVEERVAGLDAGADDYLVKPFAVQELAARVRVFARRGQGQLPPRLVAGALTLDTASRELRAGGVRVALSVRELAVLEMLMARAGHVVTKQQIAASLPAREADFSANAVEVYVYRLRKRFEGTGIAIQTVRGFGYLLDVA